jgi:hypothetical protein
MSVSVDDVMGSPSLTALLTSLCFLLWTEPALTVISRRGCGSVDLNREQLSVQNLSALANRPEI